MRDRNKSASHTESVHHQGRATLEVHFGLAQDALSYFEIVPKRTRAPEERLDSRLFRGPSAGERDGTVPALGAGATSSGSATVTIPATTAVGPYYLLACADDTGAIPETNESNNCRASAATVQVTPASAAYPP